MSTDTRPRPFDLDAGWELHPQVSVRPERFGALLYHFGTRQLSFLKSTKLVTVVDQLHSSLSAHGVCAAAGVVPAELPSYRSALGILAASRMIRERTDR